MQIKQNLMRALINGTAYLAPYVSARFSYHLWTSTFRHKMPDKELAVFNSARKEKIRVDGSNIMTYSWKADENRRLVLLLHGWNGRGTQLSSFVNVLVDAGYGVVSFDARGHGFSDGNHTNILESVAIIKQLALIHGDFFAMIGHSFGAMAAVNAINESVACEKFIGISPPTEFSALLMVFSNYLGLNKKAIHVLESYVLNKYAIDSFDQISITGIAPDMTIPCLIIHDKNDDKVPLSQAQKAVELWSIRGSVRSSARRSVRRSTGNTIDSKIEGSINKKTPIKLTGSGAKLHITEGLGHIRILHKPPALEASIEFLKI